jgi:endonuclease/exonuclease/phosphatase family metal-dependent hydrolase
LDSKKVHDGFVERGSGIGTSYNGVIPALRIDYILADKGLKQLAYKRVKPTFSDHFAVFSKLQVE